MLPTVALVGRPNVGKSRLFNRLAGRRISIVHDQPGVTRDAIRAEAADGTCQLLDTGGIGLRGGETPPELAAASERQAEAAIREAQAILFLIDGREGVTAQDERLAARLRRSRDKVVLVLNKADFGEDGTDLAGAYRLGLGEPVAVSAEHGRGVAELRAAIAKKLGRGGAGPPPSPGAGGEEELCVCFAGRPNVGKSSLANRLLQSDRLIVSPTPGTTRDAVELPFRFLGRDGQLHPFRLIDTAGVRPAAKLASPVEYFSRQRSLDAIARADVVFLVLDAVDGVTQQDKAVAGEAIRERKAVVVAVNKWDLARAALAEGKGIPGYEDERDYRRKYEEALSRRLFFTPGAPVVFVSAASGDGVDRLLNAAVQLRRAMDRKLPTAKLNQALIRLAEQSPPPAVGNRRFRIYYATQTGRRPLKVRLFCNREEKLSESYRRYLEAGLVREFKLDGCPIVFELVGKPRPGAES